MFTATKIKVLAIGGVAMVLVILTAVHFLDQSATRHHDQQLEKKAYNSWMKGMGKFKKPPKQSGFKGTFSKP